MNKLDTFNKDKFKCSMCKFFFDKSEIYERYMNYYYCENCLRSYYKTIYDSEDVEFLIELDGFTVHGKK